MIGQLAENHRADIGLQQIARAPSQHATEPKESWLLRTGLSVSVWTLAGVATVLAATGQVEFARWAGITDVRVYAVPAVLELVAIAFLLIGYRRARRGDSASTLWLLSATVGAFAVYTNVVHSGGRSGLVFGAASAITMVLWFVKLRDDYRHFQRHTGQATKPRPKLGALWLVAPRLSTRAWVIATRRRISTVDEAVGYAEVWRAVYEDARAARVGRRLARRTAWRSVAQVAGGVWADLPRTAEIAAVQVLERNSPLKDLTGRADDPAGPTNTVADSLHDRVYDFLDDHVGVNNYGDIVDDDPYLQWLAAHGLGVSVEAVAEHVRDWCRDAAHRAAGTDHRDLRRFQPWNAPPQSLSRNHGSAG